MPQTTIGKIRATFRAELRDAGISCYTLFSPHEWRPTAYFLRDLDPNLYFPETLLARDSYDEFELLEMQFSDAKFGGTGHPATTATGASPNALRAIWYPKSDDIPSSAGRPSLLTRENAGLFGSFTHRECVKSAAVFSYAASPGATAPCPPSYLFFSFRSLHAFGAVDREVLVSLAGRILDSLESLPNEHDMSQLLRLVHNQARTVYNLGLAARDTRGDSHYKSILESAIAGLSVAGGNSVLAALFLLEEDSLGLRLTSRFPSDGPLTDVVQYIAPEGTGFAPSITTFTVLTGRAHLLNYVEPPHEVSIDVDKDVKDLFIAATREKLPPDACKVDPIGERGFRLRLNRCEATIATLRNTLAASLPGLLDKIERRSLINYGMIYKRLRDAWTPPCAELCVPIIVDGHSIGCINLESTTPDAFSPTDLSHTSFLGELAGYVHSATLFRRLGIEIAALVDSLHLEPDVTASINEKLAEFSRVVRKLLWCKHVTFQLRVTNPFSAQPSRFTPLISSSGPAGARSPRNDGWTCRLADAPADVAGVVLHCATPIARSAQPDTIDGRVLISPTCAWWLVREDEAQLRLEPITDELGTLQLDMKRHGDCTWFMAIKVCGPDRAKPPPAVLWLNHREIGTCDFGTHACLRAPALIRYCARALSIADICNIVPIVWRRAVSTSAAAMSFLQHGGFNSPVGIIEHLLANPDETAVERARLIARYLHDKITAYTDFESRWHDTEALWQRVAATLADNRACQHPINIREITQRAWDVAACISELDMCTAKDCFSIRIPPDLHIVSSEQHLIEMLVQAFQNCIGHSRPDDGKLSVSVDCQPFPGGFELVVVDTTPYSRPKEPALLAEGAESLARSGSGRGLLTIRAFARALGGESSFERSESGGCRLRIKVKCLAGT